MSIIEIFRFSYSFKLILNKRLISSTLVTNCLVIFLTLAQKYNVHIPNPALKGLIWLFFSKQGRICQ